MYTAMTTSTRLTTASFDSLVRHEARPCVSLILPIDRQHPDEHRSHLHLKSLIATARAQLEESSVARIDDLLRPTEQVLQRKVIAEHSGGLALFLSRGFVAEFEIDAPVDALAATGDHFTVGPLLSSIDRAPSCHVLTVGAENVALFGVDRNRWSACEVPDLPRSEQEALWYERDERMSSSHSGGPVGGRGMSIIGHGSGAQDEDRKDRLARFFQKVDAAVVSYLHRDPDAALVVAGTAPSVARYQLISRHPRLIEAPVGSPEELSTAELQQRVNALIDPLLDTDDDALLDRLAARLGTGLAATDLSELVAATAEGRVSDLLVASTTPRWASGGERDDLLDEWKPGATDLVNEVIREAWQHGASVHCVSALRLPNAAPVAALYRY